MYNIEEDIIPPEVLEAALAATAITDMYIVYFDKDTGDILSITNEVNSLFTTCVKFEFDIVRDFLSQQKNITDYKIMFVSDMDPQIKLKRESDIENVLLEAVLPTNNWDNVLTIECYPHLKQWGFHIRNDKRTFYKSRSIHTTIEIYIVDRRNDNYIYRTIKLSLGDLVNNTRLYIPFISPKEKQLDMFKIYIKKFFTSTGYTLLQDNFHKKTLRNKLK